MSRISNSLLLSHLTCWWMPILYIKYQSLCLQINWPYARLGNKHVTTRGIFCHKSFLPLVYSFVHNFVWEPVAICFSAGVNCSWCSHLFPSLPYACVSPKLKSVINLMNKILHKNSTNIKRTYHRNVDKIWLGCCIWRETLML